MNALPEHRRILSGRTHHKVWSASDYDPIQSPPQPSTVRAVALAVLLGMVFAFILAWELAS